jgi:glucokinase
MAGPIYLNTVSLSNVPKWGRLNGTEFTQKFNIPQFLFINDFVAVSYGLLIVENDQFMQLNNKTID